ncbi:cell fate (sporulation/competence/biofilm development) regulator YlbF (YheA/YmcA/DUF963 family) [Neobacillus niacini]|nr:cell fate (sporulation/competence/biofilm development) regulator YlbF (YheA/YmcA/DUF963 family) [Neobacillus niacini]
MKEAEITFFRTIEENEVMNDFREAEPILNQSLIEVIDD